MPRRTPTKFRPLAAADEAPQPRRVDHALDLDAAAAAAAGSCVRSSSRVEAKKPRSGGGFANTAEEPQRPQQRAAAQPARPALRRRLDLRGTYSRRGDVARPRRLRTRTRWTRLLTFGATQNRVCSKNPATDGLWLAIFDGPPLRETAVVILRTVRLRAARRTILKRRTATASASLTTT